VRGGELKMLRVGSQEFKRVPFAVTPREDMVVGKDEDRLLPVRLFRAVYFNNAEGYVVLNPVY
jgi:hypothetical protein